MEGSPYGQPDRPTGNPNSRVVRVVLLPPARVARNHLVVRLPRKEPAVRILDRACRKRSAGSSGVRSRADADAPPAQPGRLVRTRPAFNALAASASASAAGYARAASASPRASLGSLCRIARAAHSLRYSAALVAIPLAHPGGAILLPVDRRRRRRGGRPAPLAARRAARRGRVFLGRGFGDEGR